MMPGDLIYAKHPIGGDMYPAKVDKVGRKWLWYTDDEGAKIRIDQRNCILQNQWLLDNTPFCDRDGRDFFSIPKPQREGRLVILTNGKVVEVVKNGCSERAIPTLVRFVAEASQEYIDDPEVLIATNWLWTRTEKTTNP